MREIPWSHSLLDAYETCPKRYYLTKVVKAVTEPMSEQMKWGNKVHKALELRIAKHTPLPEDLTQYEPFAAKMLKAAEGGQITAEQKLGLNRDFNPVSFFAKDIWVRCITDVTVEKGKAVLIADWKTGKPKPNSAQLKLSAAVTFHQKPYVEKIVNTFIWLQHGSTTTETYTPEDIPKIWNEFLPRVHHLNEAHHQYSQNPDQASRAFPPKPSGLCRSWCPCKTCEFNGQ